MHEIGRFSGALKHLADILISSTACTVENCWWNEITNKRMHSTRKTINHLRISPDNTHWAIIRRAAIMITVWCDANHDSELLQTTSPANLYGEYSRAIQITGTYSSVDLSSCFPQIDWRSLRIMMRKSSLFHPAYKYEARSSFHHEPYRKQRTDICQSSAHELRQTPIFKAVI